MLQQISSFYLWHCAQPPEFDPKSIESLTPARSDGRRELAKATYFDARAVDRFGDRPFGRNLPFDPRDDNDHCHRISMAKTSSPTAGLGKLDRLPFEILNAIISLLDIATVDQLKAGDRGAFAPVNSNPQFERLYWLANDTLRSICAIKTSHIITVHALFEKLHASQCVKCG